VTPRLSDLVIAGLAIVVAVALFQVIVRLWFALALAVEQAA
jgi:hypothetical protein